MKTTHIDILNINDSLNEIIKRKNSRKRSTNPIKRYGNSRVSQLLQEANRLLNHNENESEVPDGKESADMVPLSKIKAFNLANFVILY